MWLRSVKRRSPSLTESARAARSSPVAIASARAATPLSRKILREICGLPMLAHVYEAARACGELADVIVATDSQEILDVCKKNGWPARLTSPAHRSGTERIHEVAQ